MERKISLANIQKAVENAFENFKSINEGQVDPRMENVDTKKFGISVVLTDGTTINKGDTKVASPLGRIALVPTHVELLTQLTPDELVAKAGVACGNKKKEHKPKHLAVSPHGVRAVSVVQPTGDRDGKMDIMVNNILSLVGSPVEFDDKLYERLTKINDDNKVVDTIAQAEYSLYDDGATSVDLWTRLVSLGATTEQLATMGATIAADGRNPITGDIAFDGKIAQNVVATMARGIHHESRAWMMTVGLPAANSFGGAIVAVMPGFGAIAAYSPSLDANGLSVKAARAIKEIANELQLNVFASARVGVEKPIHQPA